MSEIPEGDELDITYNPTTDIRVRNGRVELLDVRTGEWIDCGPLDEIPVHKRHPPPPPFWGRGTK